MRTSLSGHTELKRRRRPRWADTGAAIALAVGLAITVSACGGSGGATSTHAAIDSTRVATAIETSIHHKRHVDASVTCPSGVAQRADERFYCVAQIGSHITPFRVTETGARGQVDWVGVSPSTTQLLGTTAVARAIGNSIKSARHIDAVVRCPADIPMQRGLPFACTAITHQGDTHFEVRQTDAHGHVTYHAL
jgi:hypothetical protein